MDTLAKQHQTLLAENQALKNENILLKQKIEALEKQKALQNLEDALKEQQDKKKGQVWPYSDPQKCGGYHLCPNCGSWVMNGMRCRCFYFYKDQVARPTYPQIYCSNKSQ
jgi:regulator of replication initiation timing